MVAKSNLNAKCRNVQLTVRNPGAQRGRAAFPSGDSPRRRFPVRCGYPRSLGLQREGDRFSLSLHQDRNCIPGRQVGSEPPELVRVAHLRTVESEDHVTLAQARTIGCPLLDLRTNLL